MRRLLFVAGISMASFSAGAATICVNPAGGGCQTTIGAAVTMAGANDTINIAPGTYREAVVVPAGKDGLILQGSSAKKTIIDPNGTGNPGLDISSSNVQVIGLSVNNSNADGILVNAGANRFTMIKSQVQNAADDCVDVDGGTDVLLEGNKLIGCDSDGLELSGGDDARLIKNRVTNVGDNGLEATGEKVRAERNVCENVNTECVWISGNKASAIKNRAVNVDGRTVFVSGTDASIESNRSLGSGGVAAVDTGDNPKVTANVARHSDGIAIYVACPADCTKAHVDSNKVAYTTDDANCIELGFDANGAKVTKNTASRCGSDGIDVYGSGAASVDGNRVTRCGTPADSGIFIGGTGIKTVRENRASNCSGNGFWITGAADHVLNENQAKNNTQNGFLLDTSTNGVTMTSNIASGNGEEGIQNSGDDNEFNTNVATKNSAGQDFCDSAATATGTQLAGNTFDSTATVCLNE